MIAYMYILLCSNGNYYTGSTKNLELRLKQHQKGEGAECTKKHSPVELIYFEKFDMLRRLFEERNKFRVGAKRKRKP